MDESDTPTPKAPGLDLKEIRQIVDLMAKNNLSYFHLTHGSFKVELKRGTDVEAAKDLLSKMPMPAAAPATVAVPMAAAPAPVPAAPAASKTRVGGE